MTERNICLGRFSHNRLFRLTLEETLFEIREDSIRFLFSYPNASKTGYTQERYIYAWAPSTLYFLPGGNVAVSGAPEITIDNLPFVIAEEGTGPESAVPHITIITQMSQRAIEAARTAFQTSMEGQPC